MEEHNPVEAFKKHKQTQLVAEDIFDELLQVSDNKVRIYCQTKLFNCNRIVSNVDINPLLGLP
jgi:hypothetical protein